jgi:cyclic pyranopterin monophosphate synthase
MKTMERTLTHVGRQGKARMVSVTRKRVTVRRASARAEVVMAPETLRRIRSNMIAKGDVLSTAKLAGIMAAKRTDTLIPLCHTIPLTNIDVTFACKSPRLIMTSTVENVGRTGPELEAMVAVNVAALTVYDMCKSVDRGLAIHRAYLLRKSGGKSGTWQRDDA